MTNTMIQGLLDALYEVYQEKKTFHPVDTAILLAEMFRVQRELTREVYDGKQLTNDERYDLVERLVNLARALEPDDDVFEALIAMNRFLWPVN